jgi:predicted component of type VI protein secretion system
MTALIAWKEGMALSEQHLLKSDNFFLNHIKNVSGLPRGRHFGFCKLALEENLLREGQFAFKECEVIFPSGISFIDSENIAVKIETRNFAQNFDKNLNSLDVFLALDFNSGFKEAWEELMPVLVPAPVVVFGGESLDGKEFLQAARLQRNLQGSFELDKDFYPPLTYLSGYEYFSKKLKYFDVLLQSRIENISHSKELLLKELKSLRAVWGCMQSTEGMQPFFLFCEIAKFLQEPFKYSHSEFSETFNNIFSRLNEFLLQEKKSHVLQKRLLRESQNLFSANLEEFEFSATSSVWLAAESKLSPEEAIKFMPAQLKIAPKSKLSGLVVSATHGINCIYSIVPKTIQEIPGTFYFKLQKESPLWKNLCEEKEISIYAPNSLLLTSIDILMEV